MIVRGLLTMRWLDNRHIALGHWQTSLGPEAMSALPGTPNMKHTGNTQRPIPECTIVNLRRRCDSDLLCQANQFDARR